MWCSAKERSIVSERWNYDQECGLLFSCKILRCLMMSSTAGLEILVNEDGRKSDLLFPDLGTTNLDWSWNSASGMVALYAI
mmetsp:Transcript_34076/g.63613  ORF Transcript_34076/g.63613 Transcript_34076/m.63613 type:complete len:81 (-) Transcript_34076:445-687(-)